MKINHQFLSVPQVRTLFDLIGLRSRFVGGCVRDAILGREVKDIDVATQYSPDEVMAICRDKNIKVVPTGIEFGTVTIVIDGMSFEVTSLRKDVQCDGRHAKVVFTQDWQEDAMRRDFTINAMFCDIEGEVIDHFRGMDDLNYGMVRFVGYANGRCKEDYLRILRFFRFNAFYGSGDFDDESLQACVQNAHGLANLSGERVRDEMLKLLGSDNSPMILQKMQDLGILQHIWPFELRFSYLSKLISIQRQPDTLVRLAQILREALLSKEDAKNFIAKWRFSKKEAFMLNSLVFPKEALLPSSTVTRWQEIIYKYGKEYFTNMAQLKWAEELAQDAYASEELGGLFEEMLEFAKTWQIPVFPLKAQDLIDHSICQEGKALGDMLKQSEQYWIDTGFAKSKDEMLDYARGEG